MVLLITLTVFLIVTGIGMAAVYALTAESALDRRMREMTPQQRSQQAGDRDQPGFFRRLLADLGQYSFGNSAGSLDETMSAAGIRRPNAVAFFLGIRTIVSFGPALLVLMYRISNGVPMLAAALSAVFVGVVGHWLANALLRRRANRRIRTLTESLPDALDLMVVCLESGLGLNATIARVGQERAALDDPLGNEFAQVAEELRSGRSRAEAMRGLGQRNGTDDLKSLAGLIIQSDKLGASMTKTLRAHADLLRTRRRQRAEEAARKLPIRVLFPLATLMLPALFIMVAGPAFLHFSTLVEFITGPR